MSHKVISGVRRQVEGNGVTRVIHAIKYGIHLPGQYPTLLLFLLAHHLFSCAFCRPPLLSPSMPKATIYILFSVISRVQCSPDLLIFDMLWLQWKKCINEGLSLHSGGTEAKSHNYIVWDKSFVDQGVNCNSSKHTWSCIHHTFYETSPEEDQ